jgi:predicted transporter
MNKAQKRTWLSLVISLAGISFGAAAIALIKTMQLDMANTNHHTTFRLLSLLITIPLISMVILSRRIPRKEYDERDKKIERKALVFGTFGVFIFLGAAAWFLSIVTKMGSIKTVQITLLVYLAAFVWYFISSFAILIQYGLGGKEKSHE